MADRATQLLLDGLGRAAADPGGLPLYAHKSSPGLFAATAAARPIAQRCLDEGYLHVVGGDSSGRAPVDVCALTEKGLAYLLSQLSPRQVLEDFVRVLEARHAQAGELLAAARRMQDHLEGLRATAEHVLREVAAPPPVGRNGHGPEVWPAEVLSHLARRHDTGAAGDCPLPELFRHVEPSAPGLTLGRFHDGLRRLHDDGRLYLHPWTGPLYDLPEPHFALLVGHEIAYYASYRGSQEPGAASQ